MKILLPTDFSDNSFKAICYVMDLMGPGHSWSLLHTYHTPHAGAGMLVKIDDIMAKESQRDMARFEDLVKSKYPDIADSIRTRSEHGDIVQICDILAKQEHFELIAMGTTGATGLKEALFGSIASKVIEQAQLPVLAVPSSGDFNGLKKVAIADDQDPVKNESASKIALDILKLHAPQVMMVNVAAEEEASYGPGSGIDSLFGTVDRSHHVIVDRNVNEGLRSFNKAEHIDMMIMLHRKESGLIEWLTVSTSEEMAMRVRIPLLVIKD